MYGSTAARMRLAGAVARIVGAGAAAGLIGAYPTWKYAGPSGLWAEAAACGIVALVMSAAMFVVLAQWGRGTAKVAFAFIVSGVAKVIACVALAAGAWLAFDLPGRPLLVWVCVFYLTVMIVLATWMSGILRRAAVGKAGPCPPA
ncbi:MAG: hypothetical protein ACE15C_09260 [Phycisphaerae bacterium]